MKFIERHFKTSVQWFQRFCNFKLQEFEIDIRIVQKKLTVWHNHEGAIPNSVNSIAFTERQNRSLKVTSDLVTQLSRRKTIAKPIL